jgi:hypothetical protein
MDRGSRLEKPPGNDQGNNAGNEAGPTRSRATNIAGKLVKFVIVPALIIVVIYSPRYDEGFLISLDEGHYLAPVDALLDGKTLYREIYAFYGPILHYGLALSMKLFGTTIATYRATFLCGGILVLLLSYLILARAAKRGMFAFLGGWMIAFINDGADYWYARYGGVRLFGPLASALCFVAYFRDKSKIWPLVAAGSLCALSIVTSSEMTYPALAAGAVGLVVAAIASHRVDRTRLLRSLKFYSIGFCATLLPFVIWLAVKRALMPYVQIAFYDAPFVMGKMYRMSNVFESPPLSLSLHEWRRFALTRACLVYVMLAVYASAVCYLIVRGKRNGEFDFRDSSMAVALAVGIPLFHTASSRLAGFQLFLVAPPVFVVLALLWELLYEWIRTAVEQVRTRRGAGVARRILLLLMAIIVFMGSLSWMVQRTVRRANVRVVLQNYGIKPLPAELRCVPLDLERAGVAVPEGQAWRLKRTVDYILAHTEPGEPVFALPHESLLHFLADRPPATRFSMMFFAQFRPEYIPEAIKDLEVVKPRLAVYVADNVLDPVFDVPIEERLEPLMQYLRRYYTEVDAVGDTHFYMRNDQQNRS